MPSLFVSLWSLFGVVVFLVAGPRRGFSFYASFCFDSISVSQWWLNVREDEIFLGLDEIKKSFEIVKGFVFLGIIINTINNRRQEINRRITLANRYCFGIVKQFIIRRTNMSD